MSEHTGGDWRCNGPVVTAGGDMALLVASVVQPGVGNAPKTKEEALANALLIAAAPRLLKTCLEMQRALRSISRSEHNFEYELDEARKVIELANTGRGRKE